MLTTREKLRKLNIPRATADFALPREFFVDMIEKIGYDPSGEIVWIYNEGSFIGRPRPLTERAQKYLDEYNELRGTNYRTDEEVL